MDSRQCVAIVFDENYGDSLASLASRMHVWVVESDVNLPAVKEFWAIPRTDAEEDVAGVSTFVRVHESLVECLESVISLLEDHHGGEGDGQSFDAILLIGLEPTTEVRETFRGCGFPRMTLGPEGVVFGE